MSDKKQTARLSPVPRSVKVLLEESRKLREAADRLEEQAKKLSAAIEEDRQAKKGS